MHWMQPIDPELETFSVSVAGLAMIGAARAYPRALSTISAEN